MTIEIRVPRVTACLAALATVLASGVHAWAQDRVAIGYYEVVSSGPGFGATVGPAGALLGQLAAGGRYGLLADRLVDRLTGNEVPYPYPLLLTPLAVDPARPRAFFLRAESLTLNLTGVVMVDLTSGAITPLLEMSPSSPIDTRVAAAYAVDAQRLVISVRLGTSDTTWMVVDLASGNPVRHTLTLTEPYLATSWTLSPDGSRIFRAESGSGPMQQRIVAYDASTGLEVARAAIPATFGGFVAWNDALDGVIDTRQPSSDTVFTLLTRDLQVVGTASVVTGGKCGLAKLAVSPATGRVYTFTGDGNYFGVPFPARFTSIVLGSGVLHQSDVADEVKVSCSGLRVASPPGAPLRLRATVTGATASFAWENVGGASQFTVDVGVGPGRTDLSIPLGPDSNWTIANVPAGTYYVRVRGENTFGGGRPSQEIQVVVP